MAKKKPLTMTQRKHHYYMADALRRLEWDLHNHLFKARRIPDEWHEISSMRESATMRVTIRLDEDVVKWFKSMGPKYQPRMNAVLRSFMHAKLSGLVNGEETIEPFREHLESGAKRPHWGWFEEFMEDMKARHEDE